MDNKILIFCDGACSGNPGPGGWGAIVRTPDGNVLELGGGHPQTTNNQMEMTAAIEALTKISPLSGPVMICTDSSYLIKGITGWVFGWQKNDWKTGDGKDVANQEFWKKLIQLSAARGPRSIEWKHVPAHSGIAANERVDEIAVAFSKSLPVELYGGAASTYAVSLDVSPEALVKRDPYYLSLVDGVLEKHKTWPECQKRVQGKSGAKYKKVSSDGEEKSTLKTWGYE